MSLILLLCVNERADDQDPVLYRLYEVLVVYGWSYKALIQEKVSTKFMCEWG